MKTILKIGVFSIILFGTSIFVLGDYFSEFVFADQVVVIGSTTIVPPIPRFVSLVASDPDGLDAVYGNDDVISATFDKPTNRPPAATKAKVIA